MSDGCVKEKTSRETISGIVFLYAAFLAEKSEKLSSMANKKLTPVMLTSKPCPPKSSETSKEPKEPREYPPFFEEIRTKLQTIENSLDNIEDMISRTEF